MFRAICNEYDKYELFDLLRASQMNNNQWKKLNLRAIHMLDAIRFAAAAFLDSVFSE